MEHAFIKISQRDAAQLLLFNDVNEMISFAEKVTFFLVTILELHYSKSFKIIENM